MHENYYAVIMAGGGGTRLWPLSHRGTPKQMLKLKNDRSLFQMAIDRLQGLFPPERILVVTVQEQAIQLKEQWPGIPDENYLLEPMPRGTASVVGLAAVALANRQPDAVMAVLTADHFIEDEDKFRRLLQAAYELAQQDLLVTLGIQPTSPATGYGYIQTGPLLSTVDGFKTCEALRFKEKPAKEMAEEFIRRGDHVWNSGMFIWRAERILAEFSRQMPELARTLEEISQAWSGSERSRVIESVWPQIKPQTIDYGIMEGASRVAVLPAQNLGWNDVGSWDSLFEVLQADVEGNIILGAAHIGLDTGSSLVASNADERLVVTIGVRDLIIVDAGKALLVCSVENAQRVRDAVKLLKEKGLEEYL